MSASRRIIANARKAAIATQDFAIGQVALATLRFLRLFPARTAINLAERAARRFGPFFGRHRVALDNLRQAFPEKSEAEIQEIALDMWGNVAKLAAEYIYLDKLFDWDKNTGVGDRIEVEGHTYFERIAAETDTPHILFTGHLGNFELLPIAADELGIRMTALFRPPNNPYIADFIAKRRAIGAGKMMASRRGSAIGLTRILESDGNIGLLVDQKFTDGIRTTFFGRPCETNPLLPKLVRHFECDVYPARCVRLPGDRFRLVIYEKIDLPRGPNGRVDVQQTAQLLNDTVEAWVREEPGQWMWFHKRWKINDKPRRHRAS